MLARGLSDAGLNTRLACSAVSALECIERHRPEAILLDVMMPGINGFEACQVIRRFDENIPIVFMTGLGEAEDIVRGFEVGGTDYVTKPLSIEVVIARVQSHIRTARLVRATREAVNASGKAMLACHDGKILWFNSPLRQLLDSAIPHFSLEEGQFVPAFLEPVELCEGESGEDSYLILNGNRIDVRQLSERNERIQVYTFSVPGVHAALSHKQPKLTGRESEVLLWVARGKTNRDIADILGMSPRTVNKHLEHIFEKLGVETRTAAADAAARQLGLPLNWTQQGGSA